MPLNTGGGNGGGSHAVGAQKPSFMQGASQAQNAFQAEQTQREVRREQMFRFWLKKGEKARVTFLDGSLGENGVLEAGGGFYYEHTVNAPGKGWSDFVCLREIEGFCPICAGGHNAAYVGYFTVIDHRSITGKRGTYKDQKRLYVAKQTTYEKLMLRAAKNPEVGLTGVTMDVMRSTVDTSPRVGDDFDIVEVRSLPEIHAAFPQSGVDKPTDWMKQIVPVPGVELLARGIGVPQDGESGSSFGGSGASASAPPVDPSDVPF